MNAQIYGNTPLAQALRRWAPDVPVDVLVLETWDAAPVTAHEAARPNHPYVSVRQEPGTVWIGPYRRPHTPGCACCLTVRRETIHPYRRAFQAVREGATPLTTLQTAQVIQLLRQRPSNAEHTTLWRLDTQTLQASTHRLLPVSDCPTCGGRPADLRPGPVQLPSTAKHSPHSYRPSSDGLEARWQAAFVDSHLGVVRDLALHPVSLFYDVGAHAGMPGFDEVELTSGRGVSPVNSRLAAVAEAMERYGGIRPYGKRTVVRGSYRELSGAAVDPTTLGTHDPAALTRAGGWIQPFDPDAPISWVWATSLTGGSPQLVPEPYAYYGLPVQGQDPSFFLESSNGCAVGRSLSEAVFFGLLEVVERDAFLLSWHAELPLHRIDLEQGCPPATRWRIERLQALTGYQIAAFDMTLDLKIPAVWVMAIDEHNRPQVPKSVHAAAAHVDPVAALNGALHELAPGIPYAQRRYPERRAALLPLLSDPYEVQRMQDHAALYWLPEAFGRFEFLFSGTGAPPVSLPTLQERAPIPATDLRQDLDHLLERFSTLGLSVLMVDQTAPEHRAGGLHCVKIIVPGLLPMTFGHAYRRLHQLPRLTSVPLNFGRPIPRPLNLHPHPFP